MPIHRLLEIVHLDQTRSGSYSCGLPDSFADVDFLPSLSTNEHAAHDCAKSSVTVAIQKAQVRFPADQQHRLSPFSD